MTNLSTRKHRSPNHSPSPHDDLCLHCDAKNLRERRRREKLGWRNMSGCWNRKFKRRVAEKPHCCWGNYLWWVGILLCSQDQGWKDRWWLGLTGVESVHVKLGKGCYEAVEKELLWRMEIILKHQENQKKWGKRKFFLRYSVNDKCERSSNVISYRELITHGKGGVDCR